MIAMRRPPRSLAASIVRHFRSYARARLATPRFVSNSARGGVRSQTSPLPTPTPAAAAAAAKSQAAPLSRPPSSPDHAHSSADPSAHPSMYVMAADVTENFMRAMHLNDQNRFVKGLVLGLSILAIGTVIVWINRDNVKSTTAEQVADVAKRSLSSNEIQEQVSALSQEVVHRLLTDKDMLSTALSFTTQLLHEPGTQAAISNLVNQTLNDPQTLQRMHQFSSQLIASLAASPEIQATMAELVRTAINQPGNQQSLIVLLTSVLNDRKSQAELSRVGGASAHDVFNDPAVLAHATEFMKGVLADSSLQQQASDAMWSAVRMTFKPKWGEKLHHHTPIPATAAAASPATIVAPVEPLSGVSSSSVEPIPIIEIAAEPPSVTMNQSSSLASVATKLDPADLSSLAPTFTVTVQPQPV